MGELKRISAFEEANPGQLGINVCMHGYVVLDNL